MGQQKSYKGHTLHECSYSEFIDRTKAALSRYEQGQATNDDLAQIGYAAEQGRNMVSRHGYPGYKHVYAEQEALMGHCEGVVEDAHVENENEGIDDPFQGWTLYHQW